MWKLQKMEYDRKRREISEIIKWNQKIKHFNNKKSNTLLKNLFYKNIWKKFKKKYERLLGWEYVSLITKEKKLLRNKNFLNSQNYISSEVKKFKLYYYSKEKINHYKKSKIMISKIEKDLFEKFYINFLKIIWINKKQSWYKVYLWKRFLYLVKKIK